MKYQLLTWKDRFYGSYLGWFLFAQFFWIVYFNNILSDVLLILTAVLAMNLNMNIVHFLSNSWRNKLWRKYPTIYKWLHEGEATIFFLSLGVLFYLYDSEQIGLIHHWPWSLMATIVGVMAMANVLKSEVAELLKLLLYIPRIGTTLYIIAVSLAGSGVSEVSAAVIACQTKIKSGVEKVFGVGVAASIGVGSLLSFPCAPPILMIWGILSLIFNWTAQTLFMLMIPSVLAYVIVMSIILRKYIVVPEGSIGKGWLKGIPAIIVVIGYVVLHFSYGENSYVMTLDVIMGIVATLVAYKRKEGFHAQWQHWMLGGVIFALEIIAAKCTGSVMLLGEIMLVLSEHPILFGLAVFYLTVFISHWADNALATGGLISIPIVVLASGADIVLVSFLIVCLIVGAGAGGLLLRSSNVHNFFVSSYYKMHPWKDWFKIAFMKYYLAMSSFFIILPIVYYMIAWGWLPVPEPNMTELHRFIEVMKGDHH
ncbi:MAG: hypothetical protein KAT32_04040 [Candidatus Moranbacteria bacterium]|nr:hypothetical protein [Candidatus Moranbacteria bacterium]